MLETLLPSVDYVEIAPEVAWGAPPDGSLRFNAFADVLAESAARHRLPIVAHGLGISPGTVSSHPADAQEETRWLDMLRKSHARLNFSWHLDHLGYTRHSGMHAVLPLPLPHHPAVFHAVTESIRSLRTLTPYVGYENSAWYFSLGPPDEEARFLARLVRESGAWLLLDVHNVYTHCVNYGLDWKTYIEALPVERVLQLHVSGGRPSRANWLKSGREFWLDGHDDAIPEQVWKMLGYVLPHCENARGLVVERMEGSFTREDLPALKQEVERARNLWESASRTDKVPPLPEPPPTPPPDGRADIAALQFHVVVSLQRPDAWEYLQQAPIPGDFIRPEDADGIRITALIVQKLRFERLQRADDSIGQKFDDDPEGFLDQFEAYQESVPPTAYFPAEERRLWEAFS